jgi:tRNA(fMet)-specific endonuclease VapC
MSGSLIDTNVIIRVLKNDPDAVALFGGIEDAYVSVTTVGELLYGTYKSTKREENLKVISDLLETLTILDIDRDTADSYAQIKSQLHVDSYTVPENDLWIAAVAHQHELSVATFDQHFGFISDVDTIPSQD